MKKRILSITLAALMLTSSASVFADTENISVDNVTEIHNSEENTENENSAAPVFQKQFSRLNLTVKSSAENENFKAVLECVGENDETVFINVSESALIVDNQGNRLNIEDVKDGASITVHNNIKTPALMIYPPQYTSEVIVVNNEELGLTDVDFYSESLVNAGNDLELNITDNTVIEFSSKSKLRATKDDLANANLVVFYTNSTRSIPAMTEPSKVIILENNEIEIEIDDTELDADGYILDNMEVTPETSAQVTVNGNAVDAHIISNNGVTMLPVRTIAEAMGLEVKWDDSLKAISVGTTPMGVHFTIDKDEYSKARMMPASLGQAPLLVVLEDVGVTYVPVNFFSDILDSEVTEDETTGSINIVNK